MLRKSLSDSLEQVNCAAKMRGYGGVEGGQVCALTIHTSLTFWQLCGAISLLALEVSPLNLASLL